MKRPEWLKKQIKDCKDCYDGYCCRRCWDDIMKEHEKEESKVLK